MSVQSLLIPLSDTEIGKVLIPTGSIWVNVATQEPINFINDSPNIKQEIAALKFANAINDLMPRFIRQQKWVNPEGIKYDMMVMELLQILPLHQFELEKRIEMMTVFEQKMNELHTNNFVHGDLMRPTSFYNRNDLAWIFQNVVQTPTCLRLIDAGFSITCRTRKDVSQFVHTMLREQAEIKAFKKYYLEK